MEIALYTMSHAYVATHQRICRVASCVRCLHKMGGLPSMLCFPDGKVQQCMFYDVQALSRLLGPIAGSAALKLY